MQPFRRNEATKSRYSAALVNESMIRDVCQVYEPDVIMMRLLEWVILLKRVIRMFP